MKHERRTSRFVGINGQVAVVSAMLVLLAVITLPGCPRLPAAYAAGRDMQTVTENRAIVETFASPGHYLLHGIASTTAVCDECGDPDPTGSDQKTAAPVLTIDVTTHDAEAIWAPSVGDIADADSAGSEALPPGHIARVPAPPPRLV